MINKNGGKYFCSILLTLANQITEKWYIDLIYPCKKIRKIKRKNQILPTTSLYSNDLIFLNFPCFHHITTLNEKQKSYAKQSYSPVNILSTLSKIYEKACLNNCFTFLKIYFLSASLAVAKTLVRSNVL